MQIYGEAYDTFVLSIAPVEDAALSGLGKLASRSPTFLRALKANWG